MASPSLQSFNLVHRQSSRLSAMSEEAIPTEVPKNTVDLLSERLTAWKHVVDTIEEYMTTTERVQKSLTKEYQKVLKSLQSPLKAGHHFDQNVGGIASLFENMRQNTQGLINTYYETEKNIKVTIIPVIERLRKEIKNQSKELTSGAVKSAKDVEKARNLTQKHIEMLGQNVAGFDSSGSRPHSIEDPYVVRRNVIHHLHKQIIEENNQRHVLFSLQKNFNQFEQQIVEAIQSSMSSLTQSMNSQAQSQQEYYSDVMKTAQAIPLDFEWNGFVARTSDMLIDHNIPDRSIETITFPNQDHKSTSPVIAGILERKSRNKLSFAGFSSGYYVVTLCKFLHEFKDEDCIHKDPVPELSIYLPEATIGLTSGEKFNVKGKDVSKGLSSKLSGHSDLHFKATTAEEAQRWIQAMQRVIGLPSLTTNLVTGDSEEIYQEKQGTSSPPTYTEDSPVVATEKLQSLSQPQETEDEMVALTEKPWPSSQLQDKGDKIRPNSVTDSIAPSSSDPVDIKVAESK